MISDNEDQVWQQLLANLQEANAERDRLKSELGAQTARNEQLADDLKQMQADQRQKENLYAQLMGALPVMFWILESDTLRVLYVSPNFQTFTGRDPQDLYDSIQVWREIIHEPDLAVFSERLERLRTLEARPSVERIFRIRHTSGELRHARIAIFPIFNEAGIPYRRAGMLEDVTERERTKEKLRHSVDFHDSVFQNSELGVVIYGKTGRIADWNPFMELCTGLTYEAVTGKALSELPGMAQLAHWEAAVTRALAGEAATLSPLEVRHTATGICRFLLPAFGPMRDENGEPMGVVSMVRDVSLQVRAELDQRRLADYFRSVAEGVPDGIVVIQDDTVRYANPAMLKIVAAVKPEDMVERSVSEWLPEGVRTLAMKHIHDTSLRQPSIGEPGGTVAEEMFLNRIDGGLTHVSTQGTRFDLNGKPAYLAVIRDLTEQDRIREERDEAERDQTQRRDLSVALKMVQDLSRRLVTAQDTESRRVARELHDDIGQLLTGLRLSLERIKPASLSDAVGRSSLQTATELTTELVERVRSMSLELRPTILDDLGIAPTLQWLAERYERLMQIRLHVQFRGIDRRFSSEVESGAYRLVQEALTNVARHAKVKEATVRVWCDGETLGVQVEDRGAGFDVQKMLAARQAMGLSGLIERAHLLGGTCVVESTIGEGTRITAELPLLLSRSSPLPPLFQS